MFDFTKYTTAKEWDLRTAVDLVLERIPRNRAKWTLETEADTTFLYNRAMLAIRDGQLKALREETHAGQFRRKDGTACAISPDWTEYFVAPGVFLRWILSIDMAIPDSLAGLVSVDTEAVDVSVVTPDMAKPDNLVLHVSHDDNRILLTADGKEIRFRKSKDTPSKEMQILRVLIAKHPDGATAAELLTAAWPTSPKDVSNLKRLGAHFGTLRKKARSAGLPEDIFPEVSICTLHDVGRRYPLTCREIVGGDLFRQKRDDYRRALEYNENQGDNDFCADK